MALLVYPSTVSTFCEPFYFLSFRNPSCRWLELVCDFFLYTLLFLPLVVYDIYYYWINNITYYQKKPHAVEITRPLF